MRLALIAATALAATALALCGIVWNVAGARVDRVHAVATTSRTHTLLAAGGGPRTSDAASVERGRQLAEGVALCTFCHAGDLAGKVVVDDPLLGVLYASNLTPGEGGISDWTAGDITAAIRSGVRRDGRSLLLMPSEHLAALTDRDLADLIAFLKQLEPRDRRIPATRVGLFTRAVLVLGLSPELLAAERAAASDPTDARGDRGAYLVSVGSCRVCHHQDLRGGLHPLALPGEPAPSDLTRSADWSRWTDLEFARVMRAGITPEGRTLDPRYMPWPSFARLEDADLQAIARYLRTQP